MQIGQTFKCKIMQNLKENIYGTKVEKSFITMVEPTFIIENINKFTTIIWTAWKK